MNRTVYTLLMVLTILSYLPKTFGQSLGNAGTIEGTVTDPTGGVINGANVDIQNSITGFKRETTTDDSGNFRFTNIPPNPYHLHVSATGFNGAHQDVAVRSSVPVNVRISLEIKAVNIEINVEATEVAVENIPMAHTDVDQSLISKLLVSSPGSALSDVVALSAPGVAADSNGFFHPLGDRAQTSFSIDNQPISDQQSKAFSTQIPVNAIQSM